MTEPIRHCLFVGGKWVEPRSGETFEVVDPATGETCASLSDGGREDMRSAIDAADVIQPHWTATADERAQILQEAARLLRERSSELARVMTREQGKSLVQSEGEVLYAASCIERFAEEARRISGGLKESGFGREGGRYGVEEYLDVKYLPLGGIRKPDAPT